MIENFISRECHCNLYKSSHVRFFWTSVRWSSQMVSFLSLEEQTLSFWWGCQDTWRPFCPRVSAGARRELVEEIKQVRIKAMKDRLVIQVWIHRKPWWLEANLLLYKLVSLILSSETRLCNYLNGSQIKFLVIEEETWRISWTAKCYKLNDYTLC